MQVFTTIFLAETLNSNTGSAQESSAGCQDDRDPLEIKHATLERIAMLESRNWFADDLPSEE
jgi:hypothetical protein